MRAPDFWKTRGIWSGALMPFGHLYGTITTWRANRAPSWQAPVPTICVGNAAMGGTGKTPICLDIAARLKSFGCSPHILSRGYGGTETGPLSVDPSKHTFREVGDEPLLLARVAPTWIGADRVASAKAAVNAGADVLMLDDGLQNPRLAKDRSFLVSDGRGGNGRVFPAGPMRENFSDALRRSDAIVVLGEPQDFSSESKPVFASELRHIDAERKYTGKRVVAFAGIGQPQKFFDTVLSMGANVCEALPYADHHPYTEADLKHLADLASRHMAQLLTTEKDMVRLPRDFCENVACIAVAVKWHDEAAFDTYLRATLSER